MNGRILQFLGTWTLVCMAFHGIFLLGLAPAHPAWIAITLVPALAASQLAVWSSGRRGGRAPAFSEMLAGMGALRTPYVFLMAYMVGWACWFAKRTGVVAGKAPLTHEQMLLVSAVASLIAAWLSWSYWGFLRGQLLGYSSSVQAARVRTM